MKYLPLTGLFVFATLNAIIYAQDSSTNGIEGIIAYSPFTGAKAKYAEFTAIHWRSAAIGTVTFKDGTTFDFQNDSLTKVVYFDPNLYAKLNADQDQSAYRATIRNLEVVTNPFPVEIPTTAEGEFLRGSVKTLQDLQASMGDSRDMITPYLSSAQAALDHYNQGERELHGKWMPILDYAKMTWMKNELPNSFKNDGDLTDYKERQRKLQELLQSSPQSAAELQPQLDRITQEIKDYNAGNRMVDGKWMTSTEYENYLAKNSGPKASFVAGADDRHYASITTYNGEVYKDVLVTDITADSIKIDHAEGVARIKFNLLPPDLLTKLGISTDANKSGGATAPTAPSVPATPKPSTAPPTTAQAPAVPASVPTQ